MIDIINNKSSYKWNFNEDDWFVHILLGKLEIRHRIFILKNYNVSNINDIVFDAFNIIKEHRSKLELESMSFINKKKYLVLFNNSNKIQISLEEEYRLKELIEQYKIYELISWFHIGKNVKVFKHCVLKKQEILEKIYPIVDQSIRKVIGSKVIHPYRPEFEEAVNNAWLSIIKYLPKIDTSRVMFSIFVGIGHRSAIYFNASNLKDSYNTINNTSLKITDNDEDGISEDSFFNNALQKNLDIDIDGVEDDILNEIDSFNIEDSFYIDTANDEIEDIINNIDNPDRLTYMQQNILAYSYNILSGKIKRICLEKIYAEFFNDLINYKISEKIIIKHTQILMDIMNLATLDPNIAKDASNSNLVFKLFKDWLKEKIDIKLHKYNIIYDANMDSGKKEQIKELIKREELMINYLKEHKDDIIVKLLEFKNACTNTSLKI